MMAYVGTSATPQIGTLHHGSRTTGIRLAWLTLLGSLGRQLSEGRRDLNVDRALKDLDRRQLNDIGVCRDAC